MPCAAGKACQKAIGRPTNHTATLLDQVQALALLVLLLLTTAVVQQLGPAMQLETLIEGVGVIGFVVVAAAAAAAAVPLWCVRLVLKQVLVRQRNALCG